MSVLKDFKQNIADFSKKITIASIAISTLTFSGVGAVFAESIVVDMKTYADPAPLEAKLEKYENNTDYRAEVERLSTVDTESLEITSGLSSAPPKSPDRYIVFWDTHLNQDIDTDLAISFGGMEALNPNSLKHNKNMQHITDCRDKMFAKKAPKSRMLQFQKVRNCATKSIKIAYDAHLKTTQSEKNQYIKMLKHPEVDPAPLAEKLKKFDIDLNIEGGGPYYQAIKNVNGKYNTSHMLYVDIIRLYDSVLSKKSGWDDFAPIADNKDPQDKEFILYSSDNINLDNNMGYLFKIRDRMLPEKMPQDIDSRVKLFDQIMSKWNAEIKSANDEYKASIQKRSNNVHADITPLNVKLDQFSNETSDLYKKYQLAVQTQGKKDYKNKDVDQSFYINMIRVWHAHLDNAMSLETFKTFETSEGGSAFTALNERSTYIKHNLELLLQCRDDIVGNTALADITKPEKTYNDVNDCTTKKILENNIAWKAVLQDIKNDPYFNWKNANAYRLLNKAHTDQSITAVELSTLDLDPLSDEHSKLEWNYQHVLDCRDEAIAKQKTITANDLTKNAVPSSISFDDVHECAGQRAQNIYQTRQNKIDTKIKKEHEEFVESVKTYSWIFGGLALSIGGLVVGKKVHTAKKNAPKMQGN